MERVRKRVEEIRGEFKGTVGEGRKTVEDSRVKPVQKFLEERPKPLQEFLEERPTILLKEPPIKLLRRRSEKKI